MNKGVWDRIYYYFVNNFLQQIQIGFLILLGRER